MKRTIAVIGLVLVAGCSKESTRETNLGTRAEHAPIAPAPAPRFKPAIDPRSSEAAELLVGGFVKLINEGRLADAYMLLGPGAPPRDQFYSSFRRFSDLQVRAHHATDQEGAAGSIYLSVPLDVSGRANGRSVERHATAVVRRVNDVPGSTEEQRHWHIERIDWDTAARGSPG